jgi:hypothetical protein
MCTTNIRLSESSLAYAVTLAVSNSQFEFLRFTDVSVIHWAVVLVQRSPEQSPRKIDGRDLQPFAFVWGQFSGYSSRLTIVLGSGITCC